MAKKVAVLALDPVNGFGLFQYLEAFFENDIPFKVFAVADSRQIRSNAGLAITADATVAELKGHEDEYDALVFACGDAVPKFAENKSKQYNQDMLAVIKNFADSGKTMVGHCAAAVMFGSAGAGASRKMAVHPYGKKLVAGPVATDEKFEIDGNFCTAQEESYIWKMMPELLNALK